VTRAGPGTKEIAMTDQTGAFLTAWITAEQAGDVPTLDQLLTAGFYGVGPMGFILPKTAWLARHQAGDLAYQDFSLEEIQVRTLGETAAVVTARNNTRGSYQGHAIPEAARVTLVLAGDAGRWKLAAIHLSFIAGTRGAPPLPGAGNRPAGQGAAA
jgi:ketosteroid isomerase-like protein